MTGVTWWSRASARTAEGLIALNALIAERSTHAVPVSGLSSLTPSAVPNHRGPVNERSYVVEAGVWSALAMLLSDGTAITVGARLPCPSPRHCSVIAIIAGAATAPLHSMITMRTWSALRTLIADQCVPSGRSSCSYRETRTIDVCNCYAPTNATIISLTGDGCQECDDIPLTGDGFSGDGGAASADRNECIVIIAGAATAPLHSVGAMLHRRELSKATGLHSGGIVGLARMATFALNRQRSSKPGGSGLPT